MTGDDGIEEPRREPVPPAWPAIEPAEPGDDPPELTLDWGQRADELPPLSTSSLTWREESHPTVVSHEEDEIWAQGDSVPPYRRATAGSTGAPVGRRRLATSLRLWLVLGAIAAVGAAVLSLGLRAAESADTPAGPRASAGGPAGVIVPTTPPSTSAPEAPTSSSTSTSTSSTTVLPAPPAARSMPTTSPPARTAAQPAPGTSTAYGPLCGYVPGSAVAIELNGEATGTLIAQPDGCVSGRVVVG
jgi:hypothetical protein